MEPSDDSVSPINLVNRLGPQGLHHLVYVSQASPNNEPEVLLDILRVSRWNNRVLGITGLLVYFDGRFLQYLEGSRLAVHDTLEHIRADVRHYDLQVLFDRPTDRRLFRAWDMGRLEPGSEGWRRLIEADWPGITPLSPNAVPGLEVLQELADYPPDELDRVRVLGYRPPPSPDEPAPGVTPVSPELRRARVQLAVSVVVGVILACLLIYRTIRG